VLERHLEKTLLRSPADGVVTVVVAEVGENVRVGQPVIVFRGNKQMAEFTASDTAQSPPQVKF
jgi:HlyD family secretion protein